MEATTALPQSSCYCARTTYLPLPPGDPNSSHPVRPTTSTRNGRHRRFGRRGCERLKKVGEFLRPGVGWKAPHDCSVGRRREVPRAHGPRTSGAVGADERDGQKEEDAAAAKHRRKQKITHRFGLDAPWSKGTRDKRRCVVFGKTSRK